MQYKEAITELEALVEKIEDPARDFSGIADDVKRAMELVKWCKEYIKGEESKMESLISENKE